MTTPVIPTLVASRCPLCKRMVEVSAATHPTVTGNRTAFHGVCGHAWNIWRGADGRHRGAQIARQPSTFHGAAS